MAKIAISGFVLADALGAMLANSTDLEGIILGRRLISAAPVSLGDGSEREATRIETIRSFILS